MLYEELLMSLAEIAVTIAALSAVAGAIGKQKEGGPHSRLKLLRDVALIGLSVALFAILPLLAQEAGAEKYLIWRWFSGLPVLVWISAYLIYTVKLIKDKARINWVFWLGFVLLLVGNGLFITNAIIVKEPSPVLYLGGLISFLSVACLNFIEAVFKITQ